MTAAAIIVTYFPDFKKISKLINSLKKQADYIYLVDNTPAEEFNLKNIYPAKFLSKNISIHLLKKNIGLAAAQNFGIKLAFKANPDYIVFFDQDSKPSMYMIDNLIDTEKKLNKKGINVSFIGPILKDSKTHSYLKCIKRYGLFLFRFDPSKNVNHAIQVEYVISSGSLIRASTLKSIGFMLGDLFIDWVDIEICLRARSLGFKSFIVPSIVMEHNLGNSFSNLGGSIYLHDDKRNYYIVRNACNLIFSRNIPSYWKINIFFKLPLYILFFTLTSNSKNKLIVFKSLMRSAYQGFLGNLGEIHA